MKKTFTLLIMLLIVASCSNDDTIEKSNNGNIIGTWGLYKDTFADGYIEEYDMTSPEHQTTFKSDGTMEVYIIDDEDGSIQSTLTGTWKHLGGTRYEMHIIIAAVTDIEFINDDEIRMKYVDIGIDDEEGREWGYRKRIK